MGKGFMFMAFVWLLVSIAGNVAQGSVAVVATTLDGDITASSTTITVEDTDGFANSGLIQIQEERIAYSSKTTTSFAGSISRPMVRGAENTEAAAHSDGVIVRTVEGAMLNQSAAYNIAVISDASGAWAAITIPLALLRLLGSFLFLPLSFLGTDLAILTYIWAVIGIGMIAALGLALAGGRRV